MAYPDIRDDFIRRGGEESQDEVELLVQIGSYVQHCWLAEENERQNSDEKLEETDLFHLWDRCSTKQIEDIQVAALAKLVEHRKDRTVEAFGAYVTRKFQPMGWLVFSVSWLALQLWKGFVSGIGLILLGLLVAVAAPETVKKIRGTVDTFLPSETRPPAADAQTPADAVAGDPN